MSGGAFAVEEGAVVLIEGFAATLTTKALLALAGFAEANDMVRCMLGLHRFKQAEPYSRTLYGRALIAQETP